MLVGRERELAAIDELLLQAREGCGGALLIRGEPGIGKSALLGRAVEAADGMSVVAARGVESEAELPFSGLHELLRPILGHVEAIPRRQAAALAGALAFGPPVPADPFAVSAATLSLLAAAAEDGPLLVAVDDLHWLDPSSTNALLFTARRLGAERLVLLLAARDGEAPAHDLRGLRHLELEGLDRDACGRLLGLRAKRNVAPVVADRLFVGTGGNPLALLEIASLLSPAQLAGEELLDEPLPPGASIEAVFRLQIGALPRETRLALLVAAASYSGEMEPVAAAARTLGALPDAFEPAEGAGLVAIDGARVEFRHPLLRSVVYHGAAAPERRAVHRALAEALASRNGAGRSAWHLAAAALAPDETVAAALVETAAHALELGDHAAAAAALERSAGLTPDLETRVRRLRDAAAEAHLAGRSEAAAALLDRALPDAHDPLLRADVQHLRGRVEMLRGPVMRTHMLLSAEAARVQPVDPARAALMFAEATFPCFMAGETATALETARRACLAAEQAGGVATLVASAVLAEALLLRGDRSGARALVERCRVLLDGADTFAAHPLILLVGSSLLWLEEYSLAREGLTGLIDTLRESSAAGALPLSLAYLSEVDFRTGDWAAAYANAAESLRLAEDTGQLTESSYSLACLARVEAALGREADCRGHVDRALALVEPLGVGSILPLAGSVPGLLELGLGRPAAAIAPLEQAASALREQGVGDPNVVRCTPDLVEAYARVGRTTDAERELAELERQAAATGGKWAAAASARCRGFLSGAAEFERHFADALAAHERTPTPFETARTQLCFGERLRRAKRWADAREQLGAAARTFERLGARPWAERAHAELRASGGRAPRPAPAAQEQLTPQELQIALQVAEGATNREAAAALFLSPKTIEAHLSHVYRKLGVRSRTELARRFAQNGDGGA